MSNHLHIPYAYGGAGPAVIMDQVCTGMRQKPSPPGLVGEHFCYRFIRTASFRTIIKCITLRNVLLVGGIAVSENHEILDHVSVFSAFISCAAQTGTTEAIVAKKLLRCKHIINSQKESTPNGVLSFCFHLKYFTASIQSTAFRPFPRHHRNRKTIQNFHHSK